MRIKRDKLYLVIGRYWNNRLAGHEHYVNFTCVVLGSAVRFRFSMDDVCGLWTPDGGTYRVEDGHLPDYQPRVPATALASWLKPGKYFCAHAA